MKIKINGKHLKSILMILFIIKRSSKILVLVLEIHAGMSQRRVRCTVGI